MSSLADHVDRLTQLANTIRSNASAAGRQEDHNLFAPGPSSAGPFTRAVLQTPLGDLIRDIDPSELGLFTLVQQPQGAAPYVAQDEGVSAPKTEITRVNLPIATPLRRPPAMRKREEGQKPGEHDPEVYAHAALKFLDRYQSIRAMPRYQEQAEHILDQLESIRENIRTMNETLKQGSASDSNALQASPKSLMKEEERRIAQAHARIRELKQQKEMLLHKSRQGSSRPEKPSSRAKPEPAGPQPDAKEQDFWNTPGAAARTLHFTGELLTDEQMDMSGMSASLESPLPTSMPRVRGAASRTMHFTAPEPDVSAEPEPEAVRQCEDEPGTPKGAPESPEADGEEDATVILQKPPVESLSRRIRSPPQPEPPRATPPPGDTAKRTRTKVTSELEAIVAKIWSTMGEVIMPGHPYDLTGSTNARPPHAKETMAHLQSLSTSTPSLGSPSTSSLSSLAVGAGVTQPTSQQIMTARMLLVLLNNPPSYSMSLNALKDALSKAEGAAAGVTRPIYACVAKRLLKIDRGGGEQVVRFDL